MKILLVGLGGYASNYVNILLSAHMPSIIWEGAVDPFYSTCSYKDQIDAANIPVYGTMEEFYSKHTADLAIISTPTHLHCEQSIYALSHGSNVLCEKPVAPTVEEAQKMRDAEITYNRFIAIGYQWSYSDAMQNLKKDILSGVLGKAESLKTAVSRPRSKDYYSRGGGWGGKIKKDGRLILDSIAANACAHYLNNMLFILGDTMESSASAAEVMAECYRANEIENFDTCSIKMKTKNGTRLYFVATHAAKHKRNPEFVYTFQNAKVFFSQDDGCQIEAVFHDGSKKRYGNPFDNDFKKIWDCIDAIKNGTEPVCTVGTAMAHVELIETIYRTTPIRSFAKEYICQDNEKNTVYVRDLFEHLYQAYEQEAMLSEVLPDSML